LDAKGIPDAESHLASQLNETVHNLRRKLRGQAVASLEDVCAWALRTGAEVLSAPSSRKDLVPPTER